MALQALQVAQAIGYFEFQPWNILPSLVFLPYIAHFIMLHIPCCRKTILCTHPILVGYFGWLLYSYIHTVLVASFIPFLLSHSTIFHPFSFVPLT